MDTMLIKLDWLIREYDLDIQGVIHIGAHHGQEYEAYADHGVQNMMFFEPVKSTYTELVNRLPKSKNIKTYNIALGNEVGVRDMNIENHKGQSNSFLEPGTHLELRPDIQFTGKEEVRIAKLDCIPFDRKLYNMINIDVQGFELEVFKGAVDTLPFIDIIYAEVNFEEVYKDCCLVGVLDKFLSRFDFKRVFTRDSKNAKDRKTWGDALYVK